MNIGIVIIGRNEGNRLKICFESLPKAFRNIVYVDSGSTDGSIALAISKGIDFVSLDMRVPFTAARARNEGFKRLSAINTDVRYVQFLDGDCAINENWLESAAQFLEARDDVAAVCGRLREKFPNQSIYNTLCDIEWDAPTGIAKSCGGIAMFRVSAFTQSTGFRDDLIAGEEPDLCFRLRSGGWKIWRLSNEMAVHDAAMTRFSQWWNRMIRSGFAMAQGAYLHGKSQEQFKVRESRSTWFWGLFLPSISFSLSLFSYQAALLLLIAYPAQVFRLAMMLRNSVQRNWLRATFLVLGKFPEMLGQSKFWWAQINQNKHGLIEYK
jgi:glycosyltransferase involved in cell wall biosynthesis